MLAVTRILATNGFRSYSLWRVSSQLRRARESNEMASEVVGPYVVLIAVPVVSTAVQLVRVNVFSCCVVMSLFDGLSILRRVSHNI